MTTKMLISLIIFYSLMSSPSAKTIKFVDQNNHPLEYVVVTSLSKTTNLANDFGNVMNQIDKQFSPRVLAVKTGQLVDFPNSDNIRHHIYSFSDAKPFEVRLYSGKEADPVMFDSPGVVVLGCNIHDQMLGYIYVSDAAQAWVTGSKGQTELPESVSEFVFWHPDISLDHMQQGTLKFEGNELVSTHDYETNGDNITIKVSLAGSSLKPKSSERVFGSRKLSHGGH